MTARTHTQTHRHERTQRVGGLYSLWCSLARRRCRFLFLPRRILVAFFSERFCSKKLCSCCFFFRHLKSSLLKLLLFICAEHSRPRHTHVQRTRARSPACFDCSSLFRRSETELSPLASVFFYKPPLERSTSVKSNINMQRRRHSKECRMAASSSTTTRTAAISTFLHN